MGALSGQHRLYQMRVEGSRVLGEGKAGLAEALPSPQPSPQAAGFTLDS